MNVEDDVEIRCVVQSADILGETPRWCERTNRLWWVDVRRPALQFYDPATDKHEARRLQADLMIGSIAPREAGGFVMGTNSGIYVYDPATSEPPRRIADPVGDVPGMRLNDGRCDPRGRFWVGSMHDHNRVPVGVLYRLDADHGCRAMHDGFVLPNSIAWSPDGGTMYFADTHNQTSFAFDYDLDAGTISNRRVFADWTHQLGRPDGATVDVEGYLWTCMVATGHLVRQAPDGSVDRIIQLPVTNPTCPVFGGKDLATLYITSHSQRLAPETLAVEPLAGALLALDVGVRGLPEPRFAG
ncbi:MULTISPECIES: SMP-30/gluconolactonase/LRE family protein [unclassified Bosea (in: a-proteobacteria)]|uniref:SMP-30/gluconolactonase/LRE family protein n=1 Tax=unclassified Bosea (in: a-proteobacteria) TaxID=2653178 RepID=UPI000F7E6F44|nr:MULTISPECIES: SMP-30/gluconolactonase/LRE family protein [unclassified Bosea (in: a-proteobacteria)]RXT18413.1 IclR family transcriptional regulator [Bosea sp. Tri-39]RXT33265.1 IclR family transcriptional regulator [Bosea sp. Tri-54]